MASLIFLLIPGTWLLTYLVEFLASLTCTQGNLPVACWLPPDLRAWLVLAYCRVIRWLVPFYKCTGIVRLSLIIEIALEILA